MSAVSSITVAPVAASKSATIVGAVAVGELVTVTITGGASYIASGLRIRVRRNAVDIARFPLAVGDAWAPVNTSDAVGVLTMNTVQGFAAFAGRGDDAELDCIVIVEMTDTASRTLRVSGHLTVSNWPQVEGDTTPFDLAGWEDGLAAVVAAQGITAAALAAHDHGAGGGGGVTVKHSDLTGCGSTTHAAIDLALVALVGLNDTRATENDQTNVRVDELETLAAQHRHTGGTGDGAKVSHSDLLDPAGVHAAIGARATNIEGSVSVLALRMAVQEGAMGEAEIALASLQVSATTHVVKATVQTMPDGYTTVALPDGALRDIGSDMTFDELARVVATLLTDLKTKGVLR